MFWISYERMLSGSLGLLYIKHYFLLIKSISVTIKATALCVASQWILSHLCFDLFEHILHPIIFKFSRNQCLVVYISLQLPFTYWPNPTPLAISTQNPKLKPNSDQLNIHKNYHFDRRQISVINTFFFGIELYCILLCCCTYLWDFGNVWLHFSRFSHAQSSVVIVVVTTWSRVASECLFNGCV